MSCLSGGYKFALVFYVFKFLYLSAQYMENGLTYLIQILFVGGAKIREVCYNEVRQQNYIHFKVHNFWTIA